MSEPKGSSLFLVVECFRLHDYPHVNAHHGTEHSGNQKYWRIPGQLIRRDQWTIVSDSGTHDSQPLKPADDNEINNQRTQPRKTGNR